jgi:iron complex outermembrane receptor protein
VTYKVRLEKDLTSFNMVYATVSSGFLPGDVQIGYLNNMPYKRAFAEETLTAFEVGSKNRFLSDTLQLNGAIYYYDYSGYQSDIEPTPLIPGAAHVTMTAPATMWGGDLELIYRLSVNDTLNLTGGLLDAEFTGNPTFNFGGSTLYFQQAEGYRRFAGIPPATATAAYSHVFPFSNGANVNARVDAQYFSAYNEASINNYGIVAPQTFAELAADSRVGDHTLGNLSANWNSPSGKYSVGGFVRNFTNQVYKTGVNFNYTVTPAGVGAVPSVGRSYGATVHVSF